GYFGLCRFSNSVRKPLACLSLSFLILPLFGVPIFCLGFALLVLPSLVVLHSSGSAHQRLPLFVALAFLRKWLATWKMGFSGTSKSTIARPHYSEHSRIVLFCERMLFLVSRISARANFGASIELTR